MARNQRTDSVTRRRLLELSSAALISTTPPAKANAAESAADAEPAGNAPNPDISI